MQDSSDFEFSMPVYTVPNSEAPDENFNDEMDVVGFRLSNGCACVWFFV